MFCAMLLVAAIRNVDPQMPPERFSCQCARELDEKSSLPLQMKSEGPKSGGISRPSRHLRQSIKILLYQRLSVAVLGGCGERVSEFEFPDHREIQGIFADLTAKAGRRLGFPTISQLVRPKFPTHPNREFSGANRDSFSAAQGKSRGQIPSGWNFRKGQGENFRKGHQFPSDQDREFALSNSNLGSDRDPAVPGSPSLLARQLDVRQRKRRSRGSISRLLRKEICVCYGLRPRRWRWDKGGMINTLPGSQNHSRPTLGSRMPIIEMATAWARAEIVLSDGTKP